MLHFGVVVEVSRLAPRLSAQSQGSWITSAGSFRVVVSRLMKSVKSFRVVHSSVVISSLIKGGH